MHHINVNSYCWLWHRWQCDPDTDDGLLRWCTSAQKARGRRGLRGIWRWRARRAGNGDHPLPRILSCGGRVFKLRKFAVTPEFFYQHSSYSKNLLRLVLCRITVIVEDAVADSEDLARVVRSVA